MESPERRGKNYFIGWTADINFKYDNHWFRWLGAPKNDKCDVYLLESDAQSGECRTGVNAGNDSDKFYCFNVGDMDVENFKKTLNELIIDREVISVFGDRYTP